MNNSKEHIKDKIHSWSIYSSSKSNIYKIIKDVDEIFSDYSFYPEIDWNKYGYRPPDGYQIYGAWRHPDSKVFVFLLDNPYMVTYETNTQLILYVAGEEVEINYFENKLEILKANINVHIE